MSWIAGLVEGALKGTWDIGTGIWNMVQQKKEKDYQHDLNERMFEREDNAVQRRATDLREAGINPLLAAGNAAQAHGGVAATPPQLEKSDGQLSVLNALTQAEQLESIRLANEEKRVDIDYKKEMNPRQLTSTDYHILEQKWNVSMQSTRAWSMQLQNMISSQRLDQGELDILSTTAAIMQQKLNYSNSRIEAMMRHFEFLDRGTSNALIDTLFGAIRSGSRLVMQAILNDFPWNQQPVNIPARAYDHNIHNRTE